MGYNGLALKGGLNFKVDVTVIDSFPELIEKARKANLRNLYKASSVVRTTAIRLIKRAPKVKIKEQGRDDKGRFTKAKWKETGKSAASKPGNPPFHHVHSKQGLRMIWFDVESKDSHDPYTIVGPVKFDAAGEDVPHVLEFGGVAVNAKGQKFTLAARPYMRPAEAKTRPKYPQFWQDSIT